MTDPTVVDEPTEIEGEGKFANIEGGFNVAEAFDVTVRFADSQDIRLTSPQRTDPLRRKGPDPRQPRRPDGKTGRTTHAEG